MTNILCHSSIAISVAMLVMMSSDPVVAKPLVKSKVVVISQAVTKANVLDSVSPQPVEAILASVKFKRTTKKAVVHQVAAAKSVTRIVKTDYHINADRSSQGIDSFITVDRVDSHKHYAPAIDRWTN